jgi:lipoprotein NlpD
MKKTRLIFLGVLVAAIAGCSTTRRSAPIVERTTAAKGVDASKPKAADERGYYTVKKGDTLYRIALEFGQNYRDIVAWNNLASANDIKVDQVLRVLPPETVTTPGGAQTGSVASSSGVEVRPLTASAPASAAAVGSVTHKTGPRGDKRPYSEAALAELQKPDVTVPPVAKVDPAKNPEQKMAEKSGDGAATANTEDEGVTWIWPAEGKIIGTFDGGKKGIDISGKLGQPILAAGSGTVLYASSVRGYGNLVIVKHTNNLLSAYAHNKTILVKEGQTVTRGQKIAEMGNSDADAVKLHFEIRQQGKPVDPSKFLPSR